jgi:hypothetical protein
MTEPNVTVAKLHEYLEIFHSTLAETAEDYLPEEHRGNVLHLSLLPARVVGYVSDWYGVAYEYVPAAETSIDVVRGSARVEDLLFRAPPQVRSIGPFMKITDCIDCSLGGLSMKGAFPFRVYGENTSVTIGDMRVEAGSWRREIHHAEIFVDRRRSTWTVDRAKDRAKNEIIAALAELTRARDRHVSLSDYISQYRKKTVLVLGSYGTAGEERLREIAAGLHALGYEPLLVQDIPDQADRSLDQKVVTLAAISRFVVIDDTDKSGHLMEVELCRKNNWVTILLRVHGIGSSWMTAGIRALSNVIHEVGYDPVAPGGALAGAVSWAEQKLTELQRHWDATYPWRRPKGEPPLQAYKWPGAGGAGLGQPSWKRGIPPV